MHIFSSFSIRNFSSFAIPFKVIISHELSSLVHAANTETGRNKTKQKLVTNYLKQQKLWQKPEEQEQVKWSMLRMRLWTSSSCLIETKDTLGIDPTTSSLMIYEWLFELVSHEKWLRLQDMDVDWRFISGQNGGGRNLFAEFHEWMNEWCLIKSPRFHAAAIFFVASYN